MATMPFEMYIHSLKHQIKNFCISFTNWISPSADDKLHASTHRKKHIQEARKIALGNHDIWKILIGKEEKKMKRWKAFNQPQDKWIFCTLCHLHLRSFVAFISNYEFVYEWWWHPVQFSPSPTPNRRRCRCRYRALTVGCSLIWKLMVP